MKLTDYYFLLISALPVSISKPFYLASNFIFSDRRSSDYEKIMSEIFKNQVRGDYFEFGVYKGRSLVLFYYLAKKIGLRIRFFGFDSFEGLPESEGKVFTKGQFSFSQEKLKKYLEKVGVMDDVFLIKGYYSQSLTKELFTDHQLNKASVIHIDCDLYISTKQVLSFIEPLLQNGTIIIFDDWGSFGNNDQLGQQRAFNEFQLKRYFQDIDYVSETKAFRYIENEQ